MTEESQQPVTTVTTPAANTLTPDASSAEVIKPKGDNKKEKCKPMTKVVIRRLPPSMTQAQFIEQVSPLPDHDYLHFVKADMSLGQHAFCRAYINFTDQKDIFMFREKFDNYVFVDGKGTEYPAVVEFAPFQRLPKKRVGRKKDVKCGTIETDPYYVTFLESLKNLEADAAGAQPKTEFSFQPFDNAQKRVTTTPLLEYLKQRKMEKQRVRDEKREERRRRDLERRRAKDEPTISKVLKNPDAEREVGRENKENKEDKERPPKEVKTRKKDDKLRDKVLGPRDRDGKISAKGYKDDRKQDRDGKHQRKHEDKKSYSRREDHNHSREERRAEGKIPKEPREDFREPRERRTEEKKGKSYEKMRQEKRRLAESKKQAEGGAEGGKEPAKREEGERCKKEAKIERTEGAPSPPEGGGGDSGDRKVQSKETTPKNSECRGEGDTVKPSDPIETQKQPGDIEMEDSHHCPTTKKTQKLSRRRSSLESGGDAGGGDGAQLRRHKSLDGDDQSNLQKNAHDDKHKEKKDSRKERRIRNKDRPAMEIYRPGMGRFSKQRIERGKSATEERATLSESPTNTSSDQKSELRSMTFKRSVSRDNP
ncbi:regulator of nonsense transcripts 3A [Diachasma alloeum]|uniref:regulator of nonsense transcripts 3A n=1 Tax=Diachasma alloeum TaxID=454923 RepID=UPI0007383680|nr:regulator of nonsense transcripts 3A [Diachasma alloeum]